MIKKCFSQSLNNDGRVAFDEKQCLTPKQKERARKNIGALGKDEVPEGGVEEAPKDGIQYGRKDGEWSPVVGKVYKGVDEIHVDNDNNEISLDKSNIASKDDIDGLEQEFSTELSTETSQRILADENLQTQIDNISQITDADYVVQNYSNLSGITASDNDIVKVLTDETKSNATTYYKFLNNTWNFLGETGSYYTKDEINRLYNRLYSVISFIQNVEENGFHIADNDSNIGLSLTEDGFDVAKLSEHLKTLIKEIPDIGGDLKNYSLDGFGIADNYGFLGQRIDEKGFDVAKLSLHFKELIRKIPGFLKIGLKQGDAFDASVGYKLLNEYNTRFPKKNITKYGEIGKQCADAITKIEGELLERNNSSKRLSFVHVSDNHGYIPGGVQNAAKVTDLSPAKFLVNTGDISIDKFTDSGFNSFRDLVNNEMTKPGYIVLGNHDAFMATDAQAMFDKYFATTNEHNGLDITKTYYSVDYANESVKCIFLNIYDANPYKTTMYGPLISEEQINWFASELQNAATNNLHVIVFLHQIPVHPNLQSSYPKFTDKLSDVSDFSAINFLHKMADNFMNTGVCEFDYNGNSYSFNFNKKGAFIGWFGGHWHRDITGECKDYNGQHDISITRPYNTNDETNTIFKNNYTFNYVSVDTRFRTVTLVRIGDTKTMTGIDRDIISFQY